MKILKHAMTGFSAYAGHIETVVETKVQSVHLGPTEPRESDIWAELVIVVGLFALVIGIQ